MYIYINVYHFLEKKKQYKYIILYYNCITTKPVYYAAQNKDIIKLVLKYNSNIMSYIIILKVLCTINKIRPKFKI